MIWILIIGCLVGIIGIFTIRMKEVKQKNKVKVMAEEKTAYTFREDEFDNNEEYSSLVKNKSAMDYAKLNKLISQGEIFYSKNLLEDASKQYVQSLAIDPEHEIANNKLGLIYLKKNMPSKSEAIYRLLVKLYPRNAVYHSNLALSLYNQSFFDEAKKSYLKAIKLDPKESRFISLGQVCVDNNNIKESIKYFSKALEMNLQNRDMYFYITNLLIQIQAWDEGIAFMKAFLDDNPYDEMAKQKIVDIKRLKGEDPLYKSK